MPSLDNGNVSPSSLPRGFRRGWSQHQLAKIASWLHDRGQHVGGATGVARDSENKSDGLQEAGMFPPGDVSYVTPDSMSQQAVVDLQVPTGNELDPTMISVFQVRWYTSMKFT